MLEKDYTCTWLIVTLTVLFVGAQLLFQGIYVFANHIDGVVYAALQNKLHFSTHGTLKFAQYFFSQILIYAFYGYILWFTATSLQELIGLRQTSIVLLAFALWLISIIAILSANTYYVPHSFFATLVRVTIFHNRLSEDRFLFIMILSSSVWAILTGLAFKCQWSTKHFVAITLLAIILLVIGVNRLTKIPPVSLATEKTPNVFIISFDAIRPDYLSYFNKQRSTTPNFDKFLKSSVVFTETYTPLARTFPSWVSILSAKHPIDTHAREDMINIDRVKLAATLPQILKQAGYETMYASDDNRFSNINNKLFGFDRVIGNAGDATDFLLSAVNDFPLSNLLVPSVLGKILFPYHYASHGSPHTYNPDNFLELINAALQQRDGQKLFFAVHFNTTAWPFYWFNDHQASSAGYLSSYKQSLLRGDRVLADFLTLLEKNGLLKHAIIVLISDHGITLQRPHDRVVSEELYQGDRTEIHLKRSTYNIQIETDKKGHIAQDDESKIIYVDLSKSADQVKLIMDAISPTNPRRYGIDTSYGYGNDVLSLKQYQPLLAFKTFGMGLNKPHVVSGRSTLLDIAPTILAMLQLQSIPQAAGISLMPYLKNSQLTLSATRPIIFESNYSMEEIEHDDINAGRVLAQSIALFDVNPKNDLISISSSAEKSLIAKKQRAILQGDWLLAYYPESGRYQLNKQNKLEFYKLPPYVVLVNLKTGKWTTDLHNSFAITAPLKSLTAQINQFYGPEMAYYK